MAIMDYSTWQSDLKCICGRLFLSPAALKYHQNSCPEVIEDLTDVLTRYQATQLGVAAATNDSAQEVGSVSDSGSEGSDHRGNVEVDEQIDRVHISLVISFVFADHVYFEYRRWMWTLALQHCIIVQKSMLNLLQSDCESFLKYFEIPTISCMTALFETSSPNLWLPCLL